MLEVVIGGIQINFNLFFISPSNFLFCFEVLTSSLFLVSGEFASSSFTSTSSDLVSKERKIK